MSADLDRFDRMLLNAPARPSSPIVFEQPTRFGKPAPRKVVPEYVGKKRGPRYVDHMTCPMCGAEQLGVEYHGTLMTGVKVHTLKAHAPGLRSVPSGAPRCMFAKQRVEFVGGMWRGLVTP